MLLDLEISMVSTLLHNLRLCLGICIKSHQNDLVEVLHDICKKNFLDCVNVMLCCCMLSFFFK
jgi:hypothetical protein